MKLEHINLTSTDPVATADFLCTYFGLRNEGGSKSFMLVRDDNDMVITLMKAKKADYPKTFHIGFYPQSEAEVDAIAAKLKEDGFEPTVPSRDHGYSVYVEAPGNFTVEITA